MHSEVVEDVIFGLESGILFRCCIMSLPFLYYLGLLRFSDSKKGHILKI
uniref:Uncharacterized protein n=1 Tax=Nelumbo nucifera TaxID=4432 RepID=A0A822ZHD1_NELNU|nr:TPA_asm: hypothetical protein HUJ06_002772 [Nelumbo nucifera]